MATAHFAPLADPTAEIAEAFTRWENDPALIPLARPNRTAEELERRQHVSVEELAQRLRRQHIYLIFLDAQLVGEMSYQVDPEHLLREAPGTAWIGITIGEAHGRGRGVGRQALVYLERAIAQRGLKRVELGVFEFNAPAFGLYQSLGYREFGRVNAFTYWQGRMWDDIRMEKEVAG